MKRSRIIIALSAAVALGAAAYAWFVEVPYAQWESDDGTQHIVVRERWLWTLLPVTPGDPGRAPGSITAYDAHTGRQVARKHTPDVTTASEVFLNAPLPSR